MIDLEKLRELSERAEATLAIADDSSANAMPVSDPFWRARAVFFAEEILRNALPELLEMARDGERLKKVKEILFPVPVKNQDGTYTDYSVMDLDGAIIDCEDGRYDEVCLGTMKRVFGLLCDAKAAIDAEIGKESKS